MITQERAEQLYMKMNEHTTATFDEKELDALTVVMSSDVVLKAFGRTLAYCQLVKNEVLSLDMSANGAQYQFAKGQGQIQGVSQLISGILQLITEPQPEEDPPDDSN